MPSDDSAPHPLGYYRDAFAVCLQKSCATRAKSHASICGQTRKPSGSSIRSGYRPTKSCSIGSATCSSAQSEPSNEVRRFHANFTYQARSWTKPRRVIAKVEWHPGELYPRVGFIVTNLSRPAERVVAFYNKRGTCEQWIKEGKGAIKWTRLSCRTFAANPVRLQLHALAYNLGNFLRTLATPETDQGLVADELEGEAAQDRREGGEPRTLCRLPNGGGRHPTTNVPGDTAADRGTTAAATTRASMKRSIVTRSRAIENASRCQ